MRVERDRKRARRQARRRKVKYLRRRLAAASSVDERKRLVAKLRRVSPRAPIPAE